MWNYLVNIFVFFLPSSRCFKLKRFLYNKCNKIYLSKNVRLMRVKIIGNIELSVDEDTFIGEDTLIMGGRSKITIGSCCDISSRVTIITGSHEITPTGKHIAGKGYSKDVTIGNGVWVGAGSLILGGVTVGEKSIIGAGSLVNKDIPPYTIAVGNPINPIKRWNQSNQSWETIKQVNRYD
jgi:maltose O-acetyltransferase